MRNSSQLVAATEIMAQFAEDTGLSGTQKPQRYLWTDAFAVCNFLEIHRLSGDKRFQEFALRLADQVHDILGRHRQDDFRSGWISGLADEEGRKHPTAGGLRIGKTMPERQPEEDFNQRLEWERDGQYYHYLTKWMQALHNLASATGDTLYDTWARELAEAAHTGFIYELEAGGEKRMCWKMSIDLSRPLVPAMGHHDALDGYLTSLELEESAPRALERQVTELRELCRDRDWTTDDPLGLGTILCDCLRTLRLAEVHSKQLLPLLKDLLTAAVSGLRQYARQAPLLQPAEYRLAFRELGLAIGLQTLPLLKHHFTAGSSTANEDIDTITNMIEALSAYENMGVEIEEYWLAAENRRVLPWIEHRHINMVMLATRLVPGGFLKK